MSIWSVTQFKSLLEDDFPAYRVVCHHGFLYAPYPSRKVVFRISIEDGSSIEIGNPQATVPQDGPLAEAAFQHPELLAVDKMNDVIIVLDRVSPSDTYNVRSLSTTEVRTLFTTPELHSLIGFALDASGNLFVTSQKTQSLIRVTPECIETTISSDFKRPACIAFGEDGSCYIADSEANAIKRIHIKGDAVSEVEVVAGGTVGDLDGEGCSAQLKWPYGIVTAPNGIIYFSECQNRKLRMLYPDGHVVTVVGGKGNRCSNLPPTFSYQPKTGLAYDENKRVLYLGDKGNRCVWKVLRLLPRWVEIKPLLVGWKNSEECPLHMLPLAVIQLIIEWAWGTPLPAPLSVSSPPASFTTRVLPSSTTDGNDLAERLASTALNKNLQTRTVVRERLYANNRF
ncbi:hypothetical protein Pelo_12472 [Pelomyxa schiedti]|nr:hypothetical protein Pelo_12472 [Pelomyxa schiedti]